MRSPRRPGGRPGGTPPAYRVRPTAWRPGPAGFRSIRSVGRFRPAPCRPWARPAAAGAATAPAPRPAPAAAFPRAPGPPSAHGGGPPGPRA
ncbi:hypothetical protein G6F65_022003 [Rhizopus arrhizus]|nr:hypothetical protein G6F65_022003 [Rhizopus arrhizus]